jgi:hypothetical protein
VLLGYFIRIPVLINLREIFLGWFVILTAIALVIGVWNLLRVHLNKFRSDVQESIFSVVLTISLISSFFVVVFFGLTSRISLWVFNYFLVPIESSLVAVLAIVLIYAVARIFFRRFSIINFIFAITVIFSLAVPVFVSYFQIHLLTELQDWITQVWALAGVRAILLGVALGAIATGLRILIGADRHYEG